MTTHDTGIERTGSPPSRKARAVCVCGWHGRWRAWDIPNPTRAKVDEAHALIIADAKRHKTEKRVGS